MDINFTITLGIGTPGDIKHFILDGLSPTSSGVTGGSFFWMLYGAANV